MKALLPAAMMVAFPFLLAAQEPEKPFRYNGNGHVYFTAGSCRHGYALAGAGGGGEGLLWRGLALGGDITYQSFVGDFGFGTAGLNVGYHFVNRDKPGKFDPFVKIIPLGVAVTSGGMGGWGGMGGGLNYWFKRSMALRTEVHVQYVADDETMIVFRIGLAFR